MAIAGKYGRITTECGDIPEDEPVFLLRARDRQAIYAIAAYSRHCSQRNSPLAHLNDLARVIGVFADWQEANPERMRVPGVHR